MRFVDGLAAALLLAVGSLTLRAQLTAGRVALHVVALDSSGKPVPDLTESDFTVFDNGARQDIVSFHLNQTGQPRPLVILFDLLNASENSRGEVWALMKQQLSHLPSNIPLYLYLLVEDGSLYAVHGLDAEGTGWEENIGSELDDAMRKTNKLRPQDLTTVSPIGLGERFKVTVKALDDMRGRMAVLGGPKILLWVTYGIPSNIRMAGGDWWDGTPTLHQLGARLVQTDITLYTADPAMNLARGLENRDTLDILTGTTAGSTFTADLNKAITQAEADARLNYTLEFQPPPKRLDGKYHKLRVTVARKGIHVQAEKGYFATSGS